MYDSAEPVNRRHYNPSAFNPGPVSVDGESVLLLEDSWATGATAISAAGAILNHGAAAVAVVPLARIVDSDYWPKDHPYRQVMEQPYDPSSWPR